MTQRRPAVPIKVRCPNPECAQVHNVKDRWAGKRGTCPACGAVISVPAAARDTVPLEPLRDEPELEPTAVDEVLASEVPEDEEYDERQDEPYEEPVRAAGRSWWVRPTTILTLLGLVALVVVAFLPLLPGPSATVTSRGRMLGDPTFKNYTVPPDALATFLMLVILGLGLAAAGLVLSRRRRDWVALLPVYLALALTGIALVRIIFLRPDGPQRIEAYKGMVSVLEGTATGSPGAGIDIGIGAAALAMVAFAAAAVMGHRALWARLVSAGSILFVMLVGALIVFIPDWS
jgi:hypothetical protein